jgi:hypothetical protein
MHCPAADEAAITLAGPDRTRELIGSWLHYPTGLEVNDVCEALQVDVTGVEPENPQGESQAQADAEGAADRGDRPKIGDWWNLCLDARGSDPY